jgi:hypothetical protein
MKINILALVLCCLLALPCMKSATVKTCTGAVMAQSTLQLNAAQAQHNVHCNTGLFHRLYMCRPHKTSSKANGNSRKSTLLMLVEL